MNERIYNAQKNISSQNAVINDKDEYSRMFVVDAKKFNAFLDSVGIKGNSRGNIEDQITSKLFQISDTKVAKLNNLLINPKEGNNIKQIFDILKENNPQLTESKLNQSLDQLKSNTKGFNMLNANPINDNYKQNR